MWLISKLSSWLKSKFEKQEYVVFRLPFGVGDLGARNYLKKELQKLGYNIEVIALSNWYYNECALGIRQKDFDDNPKLTKKKIERILAHLQ